MRHEATILVRAAAPAHPPYRGMGTSDLDTNALINHLGKPWNHCVKVPSHLILAFRGLVDEPLGPLFSALRPTSPGRASSRKG